MSVPFGNDPARPSTRRATATGSGGTGTTAAPRVRQRGSPTSLRAMITRWIWPVPSTMSIALTSR